MALVIVCNECFSLSLAGGAKLNPLILRTIKQSVRQVLVEALPSGLCELCVDRCGHSDVLTGVERGQIHSQQIRSASNDTAKKIKNVLARPPGK